MPPVKAAWKGIYIPSTEVGFSESVAQGPQFEMCNGRCCLFTVGEGW